MIPFVKYAKYLLAVSAVVTIASFAALFVWGLKPSIDFTGGSLLEVSFTGAVPDNAVVESTMKSLGQENILIQKTNDNKLIIRTAFLDENQHQAVLKGLRAKFETKDNKVTEDQFETPII